VQSRNQITGPGVVVQHPPETLHEARSMSRDPSTVNPGEPVPSLMRAVPSLLGRAVWAVTCADRSC